LVGLALPGVSISKRHSSNLKLQQTSSLANNPV
jgi:hypothetical protein